LKTKAVFIDMDGTLLTKTNRITKRTFEALAKLENEGTSVFLATGRQKEITAPYHRDLGLKTPMICLNGAGIYTASSREPLYTKPVKINEELFYSITENELCNVMVHTESGLWCRHMDETVKTWIAEGQAKPVYVGNLGSRRPEEDVLKYSVRTGRRGAGFAGLFDTVESDTVIWEDGFEIMSKGTSKWRAIEHLMETYGFGPWECAAFGDGPNDLEMIKGAGTGVAMGNAIPELKKAADFITLDHEEEGLALFIERNLLQTFPA
jgi:Cof subfamily protein (haloacid dehalogenase superfamily)